MSLDTLDIKQFPFQFPSIIFYNKEIRHYHCHKIVSGPDYVDYRYWSDFAMHCSWGGSITKFIVEHLPPDTALLGYCADYQLNISPNLINHFKGKIFQITRYTGLNSSIVIPGDDTFFDNPSVYNPTIWIPFEERTNKVFWRGACSWDGRAAIVKAVQEIEGCDIKLTYKRNHERFKGLYQVPKDCFSDFVCADEASKYKIWLSIEGWGCASDTTRALMSGCAVIYCRLTAPWFDKYLKHEENCMIVDAHNIKELKTVIKRMIEDTEFTKKIAENGKRTANEIFQPEFYKKFILDQLTGQI